MLSPAHQSPDMSETDFRAIADIAHREAGLAFPVEKAPLVQSRITRRLRKLRLKKFSDYIAFVTSPQGAAELRVMISSLTTNVSSFFRESHHFDIFREQAFPPLLSRARAGGRIRIWSAGCSTGQEPYSIAMTILDMTPDAQKLDIKILATDIDPNVIAIAKAGFYPRRDVESIDPDYQHRFFTAAQNGTSDGYRVNPQLQDLISFRELNLLHQWPMSGRFDAIFCRNVVIYFDEETQLSLWPRFENATAPEGWLFVGHSERLSEKIKTDFTTAGPTAYRLGKHPSTNTNNTKVE